MAIEKGQLQLEKHAHELFKRAWRSGKFGNQRYGQAFYNHFSLHRLADQEQLRGLYEQDGELAIATIEKVFRFN